MADKFKTEDCKKAIKKWYQDNQKDYPGEFKRTKKFKNEVGNWVRLFENEASNTILKVVEYNSCLGVQLASGQVGKGYLFSFCEDETYGDEAIGFAVVEKGFFEKNGCLDSVHFTTNFSMPSHLEESMESIFTVFDRTKEQVRKELLELGFTESKQLTDMLNEN